MNRIDNADSAEVRPGAKAPSSAEVRLGAKAPSGAEVRPGAKAPSGAEVRPGAEDAESAKRAEGTADAASAPSAQNRPSVLVFGGTTEGREMAEWLSARGTCSVVVSSLTEYGGSLVAELPNVESLTGRMLPDEMKSLMNRRKFLCVIDATHPYATGVSASIAEACETTTTPALRILREGEPEGEWTGVSSAAEAASLVAGMEGPVLLTTGSNDLPIYVGAVDNFAERLYVRILPMEKSVVAASELNIPINHIIAMKGPFSKELNCALIHEYGIKALVTKASGRAGGFWEKVEAARECGIELVVIHRPLDEEGLSCEQAKRVLEEEYGL